MKIKVKKEGRKNIWIPLDLENLKDWIKEKDFKQIHNFTPNGMMILGADHEVGSVLDDIDQADRLAVFTDKFMNMGHSLAIIFKERLECYDIGKLTIEDLEIVI
jgi:hypothetical protein